LNPSKAKLESKGIQSVSSRVTNLKEVVPDLNHDILCEAIIQEFFETYSGTCPIKELSNEDIMAVPEIKKYYQDLCDWDWRFGKTPQFSHKVGTRFDWGEMEVCFQVNRSIISPVKIFSDCLVPELVEELSKNLEGARYHMEGIREACEKAKQGLGEGSHQHIDQFYSWLQDQI